MTYKQDHQPHPALWAWHDARIYAGGNAVYARSCMYAVSAMAHAAGIEPWNLPGDYYVTHLAEHSGSVGLYRAALRGFLAWHRDDELNIKGPQAMPYRDRQNHDALEQWWDDMGDEGLSQLTKDAYLRQVMAVLEAGGITDDPETLSRRHVTAWRKAGDARKAHHTGNPDATMSASHCKTVYAAVRSFCRSAEIPDATEKIKRPSRRTTSGSGRRPVSRDALEALVEAAEREMGDDNPKAAARATRIHTVLLLGSAQGLRVAEIKRFKPEHLVAWEGRWYINVDGKGRHNQPSDWIEADDAVVSEFSDPTRWPAHLTVIPRKQWNSINGDLSDWSERHGHRITSHQLRKYYGTTLYAATRNPRLVQRQLRHSSLAHVHVYIDLVEDQERDNTVRSLSASLFLKPHRELAELNA